MLQGPITSNTNVTLVTTAATNILSITDVPDAYISGNEHGPTTVLTQYVHVEFVITVGTGATALVAKMFDSTGTQVGGTLTLSATAGATTPYVLTFIDNSGIQSSAGYQFQLTQTGATANGTVIQAVGYSSRN